MKKSYLIIICFCLFLPIPCKSQVLMDSQGLTKGAVVSNIHNRLKLALGDKAITNLGEKDGVIKGDILTIAKNNDLDMTNLIGYCAVENVREKNSICEIFKINSEIEMGNAVFIKTLKFEDPLLFPLVFELLSKVVDPYEPDVHVNVSVSDIFDQDGNITSFSEHMKKEILHVFSQKKRIRIVGNMASKSVASYYPHEYEQNKEDIRTLMNKDNIDVLLGGTYTVKDSSISLLMYKIDRDKGAQKMHSSISAGPYRGMAGLILKPYAPFRKDSNILCNLFYKPMPFEPIKNEKYKIVLLESDNDPFVEANMRRVDFNIIGPVEFKIIIDNDTIAFDEKGMHKLLLSRGTHLVSASFQRGLIYNYTLLYVSPGKIKKDILLSIDNDAELNLEIFASPLYDKNNINFKVYKTAQKEKLLLKPVLRVETEKTIEHYKD